MPRRVLVLGLDGASFDVIGPMVAAGRLPTLARWMEIGDAGDLQSTVPPMSFPAWSSFLTGLDPGEHGLFDFTQKVPGAYRVRFANASDRAGSSILARAEAAGKRVIALGVPGTYPTEKLRGFVVPGFDAPVSTGSDASLSSDPARYLAIAKRVGPWMTPKLDEGADDAGWHDAAVQVILDRIDRKLAFAREAIAQCGAPDFMTVVFSESDTVAHHFWRDHDDASPRHDPTASAARRGAIEAVYERLDRACAELVDAFGEDGLAVVLSDHGNGGAAARVIHLNQRLADCGLLFRAPRGLDGWARSARDALLRNLPPRVAQAIFRRVRPAAARWESAARFGGFDWSRSAAFSEEANTQPGIWINLRGREASGCVDSADYERTRQAVIDALLDWKLPEGGPVIAAARRREEVYAGPFVDRAPDIVVEPALDRGYALAVVPTPWNDDAPCPAVRDLRRSEWHGGRGRGMNGMHRPAGVWIAAETGKGLPARPKELVHVADWLGRVLELPPRGASPATKERVSYSAQEEERVARRLRALGYLE